MACEIVPAVFRYSVEFIMSRRFAPRRGACSPPGQELLGVITSHGPPESRTSHPEKQEAGRRKRPVRRPRRRWCLLKGCEQRFRPRQARQRYCSECCREAARRWSVWKAQERYRETAAGQQKRNRQSRRYREKIKIRKPQEPEAVSGTARVITTEHFFRLLLRPAGLLRGNRASAAKSPATFLFARVPARAGAGAGTGAALETGAHLIRAY